MIIVSSKWHHIGISFSFWQFSLASEVLFGFLWLWMYEYACPPDKSNEKEWKVMMEQKAKGFEIKCVVLANLSQWWYKLVADYVPDIQYVWHCHCLCTFPGHSVHLMMTLKMHILPLTDPHTPTFLYHNSETFQAVGLWIFLMRIVEFCYEFIRTKYWTFLSSFYQEIVLSWHCIGNATN
jgi:hypothetical protein